MGLGLGYSSQNFEHPSQQWFVAILINDGHIPLNGTLSQFDYHSLCVLGLSVAIFKGPLDSKPLRRVHRGFKCSLGLGFGERSWPRGGQQHPWLG